MTHFCLVMSQILTEVSELALASTVLGEFPKKKKKKKKKKKNFTSQSLTPPCIQLHN